MKRIISLFLGIMLLCGMLTAAAEESLPYIEMFKNDQRYKEYVLLTPDSCPAVCISPYSIDMVYDWSNSYDPLFVVFPAPSPGSYCRSFYANRATFEDLDNDRKYEYAFRSSYWTDEKFLEQITDSALIVSDGSDGISSAYVSPDFGAAHALVAIDGLPDGYRLEITITMGEYRDISVEDRIRLLGEMIVSDINRVRAAASVERMDRYWTDVAYRGIRFFTMENPDIKLSMEMPEITFHTAGDGEISGKMFITHYNGNVFGCRLVQSPGISAKLEFTVSTWSVYYNDADNAVSYTLSDGSEWGFCMERDKDGMPVQVYGSGVIRQTEKKTIYLTVRVSTCNNHYWWPDMDAFVSDLDDVLKYITIGDGSDWNIWSKPAAAAPEPQAQDSSSDPGQPVDPAASAVSVGWQEVSGKWRWFAADGTMAAGWQEIDGKWYWFDADGIMAAGWQEIGGKWYWFAADGTMATGWQEIGSIWYWFTADGTMATGWQEIDSKWYWFSADGAMATGLQEIDGKQELFSDSGVWQSTQQQQETQPSAPEGEWLQEGGAWYYAAGGTPVTGWQKIDSDWYFFDGDGRMTTGWEEDGEDWYYLRDNGTMASGWQEADGVWYYFHGSGKWETQVRTFGQGDAYYTFPGTITGSMGFSTRDAADPAAAARLSAALLTDYKVAQAQQADAGKLFEPDPLANPFFIGTDGFGINLMVISRDTNQVFFLFYDTQTGVVFSYYEYGISSAEAENAFAVLCPDGYLNIPQDTLQSVYN